MKKILIVLCLSYLMLTTTTLYAEKILPVFSGRWMYCDENYTKDCPIKRKNVCETSYSYEIEGPKQKVMEEAIAYIVTKYCKGSISDFKLLNMQINNAYFPGGPLTHSDYAELIKKDMTTPQTEEWWFMLNDNSPCGPWVHIRPIYTCPTGSGISYDEKGQAYCNKIANTKACVADVVGRDYQGIPSETGFIEKLRALLKQNQ